MKVRDVMTEHPACCTASASLEEAARLMCDNDCGEIPVVESERNKKPVGVITDRDVCCRGVAQGRPGSTEVRQCMSQPVVTVTPEADLEACCDLMERHQIRRIPVVDKNGACCGIVSQADIAMRISEDEAGEVVRAVSQPISEASRLHL